MPRERVSMVFAQAPNYDKFAFKYLADANSTFAYVSLSFSRECCERIRGLFWYLLRNIPIFHNLVRAKAKKMNLP